MLLECISVVWCDIFSRSEFRGGGGMRVYLIYSPVKNSRGSWLLPLQQKVSGSLILTCLQKGRWILAFDLPTRSLCALALDLFSNKKSAGLWFWTVSQQRINDPINFNCPTTKRKVWTVGFELSVYAYLIFICPTTTKSIALTSDPFSNNIHILTNPYLWTVPKEMSVVLLV